jgi:hypothetical protein
VSDVNACLAFVLALIAGTGSTAFAQSTVEGLVADLDRLRSAIASTPHEQLHELAATVPPSWNVVHEGQPFDVPAEWITRALEEARKEPSAWPARRDALSARVEATRREVASLLGHTSRTDVERSRQVAAAVLARKEFQRSASDTVFAQLRRRITEWLISMWDRFGGSRLGTRQATTVVAWVSAIAALLALSWWLVSSLLRTSDRGGLSLTAPVARRRSARAWARQAAAAPDAREVVRCAYRAAVVSLEEEGAWRADEARTPREHLRLLPTAHRRRPIFADVARRFEEVWFGAKTPTAEDAQSVLSRLRELGCLPAD